MEYNDWYERYQKYQAQQNPQPKKKKGVSIAALSRRSLLPRWSRASQAGL